MQLNEVKAVYFIGIGGIGMSALARYFVSQQIPVGGYDKTHTPLTAALEGQGMFVHYEDNPERIPDNFKNPVHTLVVFTPAVPVSHRELDFFRQGGYAVKKRSEVLGMITNQSISLAVAGTHGKTTTSSILAHLLNEEGMAVMAFLGGISEDFGSNYLMKGTSYAVVEADEYDRSFLWLKPNVACITSMDADHLDIYGSGEALKASFEAFAGNLKPGGKLIVRKGLPLNGITYGIEEDADYTIRNLNVRGGEYVFDIHTPKQVFKEVRFGKPGRHNLLNGLAAFAMADQVCETPDRLIKALASFKGVERRFTYKIKTGNFIFIDDYAHHPSEIDAVYQAVREMHPGRRTLAVFQPHLFSRTRDFGPEFAESLSRFDGVILLEIYPAREAPIEGIDSAWLLDQIRNEDKMLVSKEELGPEIQRRKPEILVTMGAGDIGLEVEHLKKELSHAV